MFLCDDVAVMSNDVSKTRRIIGAAIILMVTPSLISCYGISVPYMDLPATGTSLVFAVLSFTWNISAVLTAANTCKIAPRLTLLCGCTLASTGLALCYANINLAMLCVFYGVSGGLCLGIVMGVTMELIADLLAWKVTLLLACCGCVGSICLAYLIECLCKVFLLRGALLIWSGILLHGWVGVCLLQVPATSLSNQFQWRSSTDVHKSDTFTIQSKLSEKSYTVDNLANIDTEYYQDGEKSCEGDFLDDRGWKNPFCDKPNIEEYGKPYIGKIMWYSLEILPRIPEEQEPSEDSPMSSRPTSAAIETPTEYEKRLSNGKSLSDISANIPSLEPVPKINAHFIMDSLGMLSFTAIKKAFKNPINRNGKFFSKKCNILAALWIVTAVCIRLVHLSAIMMIPSHRTSAKTLPPLQLTIILGVEAAARTTIASLSLSVKIRKFLLLLGLLMLVISLAGVAIVTNVGISVGCCVCYGIGMGICCGVFIPLMERVVTSFVITARFIFIFTALASICCIPVWGVLYEATSSWSSSWLCLSGLCLLAFLLLLLESLLTKTWM